MRLIVLLQETKQLRRDQQLLHEQSVEQNLDTIARRELIEDRDTILAFTSKIQEFQDEIHCMNDWRDFQDVEPAQR